MNNDDNKNKMMPSKLMLSTTTTTSADNVNLSQEPPTSTGASTTTATTGVQPRRPLSAYNLFFRAEREQIKQALAQQEPPADFEEHYQSALKRQDGSRAKASTSAAEFQALASTIAARWKTLDKETRKLYTDRAAEEMKAYKQRKMEYHNQLVKECAQAAAASTAAAAATTSIKQAPSSSLLLTDESSNSGIGNPNMMDIPLQALLHKAANAHGTTNELKKALFPSSAAAFGGASAGVSGPFLGGSNSHASSLLLQEARLRQLQQREQQDQHEAALFALWLERERIKERQAVVESLLQARQQPASILPQGMDYRQLAALPLPPFSATAGRPQSPGGSSLMNNHSEGITKPASAPTASTTTSTEMSEQDISLKRAMMMNLYDIRRRNGAGDPRFSM